MSELSCTRCHAAPGTASLLPARRGPVLDAAGTRLQADWLRAFLSDPAGTSPGTTMPDVLAGLPAETRAGQIDALVHYLVSRQDGNLEKLAKYSAPATGGKRFARIGCAACHADPVRSDPLDAHRAAGLVSLEGLAAKYSHAGLTTFLAHPLAHRPGGRMPGMHLGSQEAADLAAYLLDTLDEAENKDRAPLRPFPTDPVKVAEGGRIFRSAGCANCHDEPVPEAAPRFPPLARLLGKSGGCLEATPARGRPHYGLSPAQAAALRAVLAKPLPPMDPGDRVHLTIKSFNCYACHMRCGLGGPGPEREAYFTGDKTLGDHGRFPPHLTDVGRKLTKTALKSILAGKGGIRPYLHTRMPDFGAANVGHLVDDFPRADDLAGVEPVDFAGADPDAGRILMGTRGGVGCITCHGVQDRKGIAMESLTLSGATGRYRPGWFHEHLIHPARLRPGTLMPSFWPGGVAGNRTILAGDTDRQIASIWMYLREGGPLPPGFPDFDAGEFEIVPKDRPVVQRTMMPKAGTHAIAVGFPAGVHLAFDGASCRPVLMWRGRFIDAYNTWFSRKNPTAVPLGTDVVELPASPLLALPGSPAPRFEGYELDASGVPSFIYRLGPVRVTDRLAPAETGVLRTLRVTGAGPVTIHPGRVKGLRIKLLSPGSPALDLREGAGNTITISYQWAP
ncbi:MAG: hypothetical protein HKO57_06560 [Akkermansiaceae bacterium]|nr:hypothetical protein [Akkermansiaceae bacterium]